MFPYQGKTALVTGASVGIGAAFARELASRGMNLILVARDEGRMQKLAAEIKQQYGTAVHVAPADLSLPAAAEQVKKGVAGSGREVDLLVNNAGFMSCGPFEEQDPAKEEAEVMVNVAALVGLTHAFLPGMLARGAGGVVNVASIAAFQPIPHLAVYAATKAFVVSFSAALWEECRGRGVRVVGLCPGTTSTELFDRAAAPQAALGKARTSEQVVATALAALDRNRCLAVDGWKNFFLTIGPRLIPTWFAAKCAGDAVRGKAKA